MILFAALAGAAVGSFLNVCIDRLPSGRSLLRPPSQCDACGRRLTPLDLIPILSYILLRGRCRSCGAHISYRLPLVEAATAGLFALLWHYFPGPHFLIAAYYGSLFLVIALIDLKHTIIPNQLTYPALLVAVPLSIPQADNGIVSSLTGGAIGLALGVVPLLLPHGMGWGDVKMSALMGFGLGYPNILVALALAVLLGGIVGIVLLASGMKGRRSAIPFGPFLSMGALAALVWGRQIADLYLRLVL